MIEDRRQASSEKRTALTDEIGTTFAQLVLLWPWQRTRAKVLSTHLGKLYGDLLAELGGSAASMAAKAVVHPLKVQGDKLDEVNGRLGELAEGLAKLEVAVLDIAARLEAADRAMAMRVDALEQEQQRQGLRLNALEAGGQ